MYLPHEEVHGGGEGFSGEQVDPGRLLFPYPLRSRQGDPLKCLLDSRLVSLTDARFAVELDGNLFDHRGERFSPLLRQPSVARLLGELPEVAPSSFLQQLCDALRHEVGVVCGRVLSDSQAGIYQRAERLDGSLVEGGFPGFDGVAQHAAVGRRRAHYAPFYRLDQDGPEACPENVLQQLRRAARSLFTLAHITAPSRF